VNICAVKPTLSGLFTTKNAFAAPDPAEGPHSLLSPLQKLHPTLIFLLRFSAICASNCTHPQLQFLSTSMGLNYTGWIQTRPCVGLTVRDPHVRPWFSWM